jgi:hypothetical protein
MKSDWRANQFHAPHDQEDKPDGFVSVEKHSRNKTAG